MLKQLQERFAVFRDCRPLAIGIDKQVLAAVPDLDRKTLRVALRMHVGSLRYLKAMQQATLDVMEKAGVTADDIALFVPHQANMRIIKATAERAKFPMEKVYVSIGRYGNTSSASIPTALRDAYAEGRVKKGDLVLSAAFGAGLTWAAALFRI